MNEPTTPIDINAVCALVNILKDVCGTCYYFKEGGFQILSPQSSTGGSEEMVVLNEGKLTHIVNIDDVCDYKTCVAIEYVALKYGYEFEEQFRDNDQHGGIDDDEFMTDLQKPDETQNERRCDFATGTTLSAHVDWRIAAKAECEQLKEWQRPTRLELEEFAFSHFASNNSVEDVCFITGLPESLVQKWHDEFLTS